MKRVCILSLELTVLKLKGSSRNASQKALYLNLSLVFITSALSFTPFAFFFNLFKIKLQSVLSDFTILSLVVFQKLMHWQYCASKCSMPEEASVYPVLYCIITRRNTA